MLKELELEEKIQEELEKKIKAEQAALMEKYEAYKKQSEEQVTDKDAIYIKESDV